MLGLHRRDMLRIGSLTLGTGLLANSRPALASGTASPQQSTVKSVIMLWMGGGVTHIDSFDPKPDAPEEIRGTLTDIATCLPGVRFCETMPQLSRIADQLAVLRTFSHDSNDHLLSQVYTLSGRKVARNQLFSEPNIGSIISFLQGPRNGLPGYIAVPGITRPGPPPHDLFVGGWLGKHHAPFCVGGRPEQRDFTKGLVVDDPSPEYHEDLRPRELTFPDGMDFQRLRQRAGLRHALDRVLLQAERHKTLRALEGQYDSALHLLTSPQVREAFNLSEETPALRDAYGRTKIGGRCLLARRLVAAGARFVMVDYGYDPDYGNLWDNHNAPSQNQPHISKMAQRGYHVAGIDRAFAALISDMQQRGLLDSTLIVFLTEFGRTPKINARGGRDHWGAAGSLFFTGGGTPVGQVIGATDAQAAYPITRSYTPADVAATIYARLGIDTDIRIRDPEKRPHPVLDHGLPIPELL